MFKKNGFTLIELLIVISIIGILSIIGLVAYNTFLKNARDAKRQSDLKFIQSALEEYHADQHYYPTQVIPDSSISFGNKIYLTKTPNDPTSIPNYSYVPSPPSCSSTFCTSYCLFAQLENTNLTSDPNCTTLPFGFTPLKAYGVTRP